MKTTRKFIYTTLLALLVFNMANLHVFAGVDATISSPQGTSSAAVHRDPELPASSEASAVDSSENMDTSSISPLESNEPVVAENGEYAVYLGMSQELPNQTPKPTPEPTPTPTPTPIVSSSSEDTSSSLEQVDTKPEKVKLPPTCSLCRNCNGLLGVCLYVWISFVILILLGVLILLIVMLNAGNSPKPKKEKKSKKSTEPSKEPEDTDVVTASTIKSNFSKMSMPHLNLSFNGFGSKNEMKIIKTKVRRSNKAKRFNIGSSTNRSASKTTSTQPPDNLSNSSQEGTDSTSE